MWSAPRAVVFVALRILSEQTHNTRIPLTANTSRCRHSVAQLIIEKAKVPSLKVRRMRTMAIECFKILSKLSTSCLHDLVVFKDCKYEQLKADIMSRA
jgi:hypothetical protein